MWGTDYRWLARKIQEQEQAEQGLAMLVMLGIVGVIIWKIMGAVGRFIDHLEHAVALFVHNAGVAAGQAIMLLEHVVVVVAPIAAALCAGVVIYRTLLLLSKHVPRFAAIVTASATLLVCLGFATAHVRLVNVHVPSVLMSPRAPTAVGTTPPPLFARLAYGDMGTYDGEHDVILYSALAAAYHYHLVAPRGLHRGEQVLYAVYVMRTSQAARAARRQHLPVARSHYKPVSFHGILHSADGASFVRHVGSPWLDDQRSRVHGWSCGVDSGFVYHNIVVSIEAAPRRTVTPCATKLAFVARLDDHILHTLEASKT